MSERAELAGVHVRLGGNDVLRGADLELRTGELTLLLGRNGAGKSTLMRLLTGQLLPRTGAVRVLGRDPGRDAEVRGRIAFVPSAPDLPRWMSLADAARFEERLRPRWSRERLARVADGFGVPTGRPIAKLSKGQAASALLALAFAAEPELLLLDEPFSGLDAIARDELLSIFLRELDLADQAVLLTTHDLDLGARIADRVVFLTGGRFEDRPELSGTEPNPAALKALVAGRGGDDPREVAA
jgi:ABC-2 type transport system ATP-binding protein